MKMNFRMIALDLDGTLLDYDEKSNKKVIQKLMDFRAQGGLVCVATGRRLEQIQRLCGQIGLLPDFAIPEERFLFASPCARPVPLENWNQKVKAWTKETIPDVKKVISKTEIIMNDAELSFVKNSPYSFRFFVREHALHGEKILLNAIQKLIAPVTPRRNRLYLTAVDGRTGKGNTITFLSDMLNIPHEKILVIGDSQNDQDMMREDKEFFPCCPSNAEENIKRSVQKMRGIEAKSPWHEGVLEILTSLGFK